jgi:hypothetical protein
MEVELNIVKTNAVRKSERKTAPNCARFRAMRNPYALTLILMLTATTFNSVTAATTPMQPLGGYAWSTREIRVIIQNSPQYAHDAVLQAMETWNRAQAWFANTYHVPSRPYTFFEAQQPSDSYVTVTFNQTQTRSDWSLTWPTWSWDNNGVFYKITVSTSIDLITGGERLSSLKLRSLATSALGFALGLSNTDFDQTDLLNWYSVNYDVVVPSTLNLYAVALLSNVNSRRDMPTSPVVLPAGIPYLTPPESAVGLSNASTTLQLGSTSESAISITETPSSQLAIAPNNSIIVLLLVVVVLLVAVIILQRRKRQTRPVLRCPKCGAGYASDDAFCSECGRSFEDHTQVY